MADIEKVIKALELCSSKYECCKENPNIRCPYDKYLGTCEDLCDECTTMLAKDALELLKEYKRQDKCPCAHCTVWECNEVCEEYKKWKNS